MQCYPVYLKCAVSLLEVTGTGAGNSKATTQKRMPPSRNHKPINVAGPTCHQSIRGWRMNQLCHSVEAGHDEEIGNADSVLNEYSQYRCDTPDALETTRAH